MFILASSSTYRANQLKKIGLECKKIAPNIDETPLNRESAELLSQRLALQKCEAVLRQLNEEKVYQEAQYCVIAADQVAECEGTLLGKPGNHKRNVDQLSQMAGKTVRFVTSICVKDSLSQKQVNHTDITLVEFRQLSRKQIEFYVNEEQPYDCAGGFKVESLGIALFNKVVSEDPSALIGLPLIGLTKALQSLGYDLLTPTGRFAAG